MNDVDPPWDELPHNPIRFFGLEPGFQRNELKRSYTKLIKRFKPEKHPQEFQQIRAAYEQLDQQLRYGEAAAQTAPTLPVARQDSSSQTQRPPSIPTSATASPADLLQQEVQRTSADAVYLRLSQPTRKSPFEFYALAILSDVVSDNQHQRYLDWLLAGLKQHPSDASLLRLVHAMITSGALDEEMTHWLPAISESVQTDVFFQLTEPLWHRLLDQVPFDEFAELLSTCERNLRDPQIQRRCVFYLQLMRLSVFRAPTEWLTRAVALLEDNPDQLPPYLELDAEVTLALVRFRLSPNYAEFAAHPLRQAIQEAMMAYCLDSDGEGVQKVANVLVEHAGRWQEIADAFPFGGPDFHPAFEAWSWVCHDVQEKLFVPQREADWDRIHQATFQWVSKRHEQDHATVNSTTFRTMVHALLGTILFFVGTIGAIFLLIALQVQAHHITGSVLLGGLLALIVYQFCLAKQVNRLLRRRKDRQLTKLYRNFWRPRLVQFGCAQGGHFQFIRSIIAGMAETNEAKSYPVIHLLAKFSGQDTALSFYELTFLFQR
ncbi:MAG: J domain-containing protein [Pirellulaceae bacterium]